MGRREIDRVVDEQNLVTSRYYAPEFVEAIATRLASSSQGKSEHRSARPRNTS